MRASWRLWAGFGGGVVVTTLLYAVVLGPLEAILRARGHGILDLELAWTTGRFDAITSAWEREGVLAARRQTWWDFLFVPAYVVTIRSALLLAARGATRGWRRWAERAAAGIVVAGAADYGENVGLLLGLRGSLPELAAPLASTLASLKFALLAGALLTLLVVVLARVRRV